MSAEPPWVQRSYRVLECANGDRLYGPWGLVAAGPIAGFVHEQNGNFVPLNAVEIAER